MEVQKGGLVDSVGSVGCSVGSTWEPARASVPAPGWGLGGVSVDIHPLGGVFCI